MTGVPTKTLPLIGDISRLGDLPSPALGLQLLAASPDCVKLVDLDGRVQYSNENGMALVEAEDFSAIKGRVWTELWPEQEREGLSAALETGRQGDVGRFTGFCPTTKGNPKWWDVVVAPVKSEDGKVVWLLCISRDITEQRVAEESLKVSEQRFRALADNMAQLAWMADQTGHLFWYNKRWFDYTGMDFAAMQGWGWQKVHHPEHIDRVVQKWTANLQSGDVWEDIFPLRAADGEYRWFLSRAIPIRDSSNRIVLWCGTNTDITEQRRATQRLRQKARLIELSHEAIFSWDIDGAILTWNRGCEELYGYTQAEAIGAISHELLKSEHPLPCQDIMAALRADGSWYGEILHYAKDGTKIWVDSRHEVLKVGGRHIVLETNRDITERRKSDEIRNLLVGELNHRVKNTLAIVQSVATQTARGSPTIAEFVESFSGRLQSLASAHNVLTEAHWFGADLRTLVDSEFAVTVGSNPNITVRGEDMFIPPQTALHFTLILHELVTNALKHGSLSVAAGRVDVSWNRLQGAEPKLQFSWVETAGPPVVQPRRRGFGATLIERSGNLPHLKASLHFNPGGVECHILADLVEDKRVAPTLFDPIRANIPLTAAPRPITQLAPRQARRILVVEDEPLIAMEIEELLNDSGFVSAGPATTVTSAMQAISRGAVDAVILDGNLLGSPVDDVVDKLVSLGLPFIMVTGYSRDAIPHRAAGVPVLTKPIRLAELQRALHAVLTQKVDAPT